MYPVPRQRINPSDGIEGYYYRKTEKEMMKEIMKREKVFLKTAFLWVTLALSFTNAAAQDYDYGDDFAKLPAITTYGSYTTPGGWSWVMSRHYTANSAVLSVNGGKNDLGSITSPVFTHGCSAICLTCAMSAKRVFKIEIKQENLKSIVWDTTITSSANITLERKNLTIEGEFQIVITNITNGTAGTGQATINISNICITANPTVLPAPAISVSGIHPRTQGGYWDTAYVSLSHELGSAVIYYTTDGSDPNPTYDSLRYAAPFEVTKTTQVKAIAVRGDLKSEVTDSTVAVAATTFSFVVPKEATVFVGEKDQTVLVAGNYLKTHFVPFTEKPPAYTVDTLAGGAKKQVFYGVGGWHNYRVSMNGKLTHVGRFYPNATNKMLEVTQAQLDSRSPKEIDHDVNSNNERNHSDIFLNINAAGHLRMAKDSTFYLMSIRVWQAINSDVDNYFIEPDFHHYITNEAGEEDNSVVTISTDGTLTAVGTGTAIVRVTYDAFSCASAYGGPFFSALWPENTGVFVVTVSDAPDAPATGISSNMHIGEYWNTASGVDKENTLIDAEGDILYYPASSGGFDFTFKPEGVSTVTLAQPALHDSILSYPGGFSASGVTAHADGSYTVRTVHGRNIVKLTNASGESEYQVISAKPVTWTVSGASGSGGNLFRAGDTVAILFGAPGEGGTGYPLYHPHNKLAGIYNMSAGIQYTGFETNFPLILGPGQYTFASRAQQYKIVIPAGYAGEEVTLTNGVIKVSGYGDAFPAHRSITKKNGVPPNLNAGVRTAYFGSLPDFYFRLVDNPSTPENLAATPEAGSETVLNLSWEPSRDNGSIAGYLVSANGEYKGYITETSYQLTGLTPGTQYLVEVEAVDNGTLRSAKAQVAARTHDFTAPTAPAALAAAGATETGVTLAWRASTDNSGVVAGYIVYLDGDSVGLAGDTSYTVAGLTVVTAYSFEVAAVDSAGNTSAKSAALSVTTPDLTAPSKPGGMMKLSETATSVALAWTASTDNVGVAGYLVTLNGDSVNFLTQNSVTVIDLPPFYVIGVYATDTAGNRSEPAYYSVDNEAPTAPVILAATPAEASVDLLWTPSTDNLVVAGYIVYLNGDSVGVTTDTSYAVAGLSAGTEYALAVAAFDAAGNLSDTAAASATTLDLTPPTIPAGLTATPAETGIALSWTPSADNAGVAGYIVYLDGDSASTVTDTAYTFAGLTAATEYTLAVAAFDAAGNLSDTAAVTASTTPAASTGVQQVGKDAAFAYPNPFGDYLVVEAGAGGEVVIYNLQSQVALRAAVSAGRNRVDVSALPQGMYIVQCGELTQLLVKQ